MRIKKEENSLAHIGVARRSGRYPYGSGGNDSGLPRNASLLDHIDEMKSKGLTDKQIYEGLNMTSTKYRQLRSIAKAERKAAQIARVHQLAERGHGNSEIGRLMNLNESTVRSLRAPAAQEKIDIRLSIVNKVREHVEEKGAVDIGVGVENHLGITKNRLSQAVAALEQEGYVVHNVKVPTMTGNQTTVKVLAKPEVPWVELKNNPEKIGSIAAFSEDGGKTFFGIQPPLNVSSKKVKVIYADQGGAQKDGVIELRPGVKELSLGGASYAQVRIAVDGTHYLKGMAVYNKDMPPGVDIQFNTNKLDTGKKMDAMKALKDEEGNPFGAIVRQMIDPTTGKVTSALNIVGSKEGSGEEGSWDTWSRTLSTQMLSKQKPALAEAQLKETFAQRKATFDEINALTNPTVRKKLLEDFAEDVDSAAVHLKAAQIPRQRSAVILPVNSLKDTEVYAPNFNDGERVVLVRYPHGGIFEIPELTVNNRNREAKETLGAQAADAIGINHKVAARLSGADFDGDTVLVIPQTPGRKIQTKPPLEGLKDFDPQKAYPGYEGMAKMTPKAKQTQMGDVSNLITDMTIRKASDAELARAVRHSMVVIDAEKHGLNYKLSAEQNGIKELKTKYQGGPRAGASTLISQKKQEMDIPERRGRSSTDGGPIDKKTGERKFTPTGKSYVNKEGQTVVVTEKVKKLAEVKDAHDMSSGTKIEGIYADHSNRLKALANEARKEAVNTPNLVSSSSAAKVYAPEVAALNAKLNTALKNAPLERQAQVIARAKYKARLNSNPEADKDEEKKIKRLSLLEARSITGAGKEAIHITDREWEAIQAGAISNNKLGDILNNADMKRVKELATPRSAPAVSGANLARAQRLLAGGATQAEVASSLGVSLSTLKAALKG